jgi:hypothetical protein
VVTAASRIVASRIVAARRALVAQHEGGEANLSGSQDERRASKPTLESALAELNGALTGLADDYRAIAGKSRERSAAPNEMEQPA